MRQAQQSASSDVLVVWEFQVDTRATWDMVLGFQRLAPTPTAPAMGVEAGLSVLPVSAPSVRPPLSVSDPWAAFADGYRAWGGREEWLEHFVNDVLPCESSEWGGWYDNGYVSRAQFAPGSWATAVGHTGLSDPTDPYAVGAAVAWWSAAIEHPGSTSGWATCWWRGVVP